MNQQWRTSNFAIDILIASLRSSGRWHTPCCSVRIFLFWFILFPCVYPPFLTMHHVLSTLLPPRCSRSLIKQIHFALSELSSVLPTCVAFYNSILIFVSSVAIGNTQKTLLLLNLVRRLIVWTSLLPFKPTGVKFSTHITTKFCYINNAGLWVRLGPAVCHVPPARYPLA